MKQTMKQTMKFKAFWLVAITLGLLIEIAIWF